MSEQVKTLRDDLHKSKLELSKLHQLESLLEEVKRVKHQRENAQEQYDAVMDEFKSSQLNVVSLEDQLRNSQRQYKEAQIELEGLERERDVIQQQVATMNATASSKKSEYDHQVHVIILFDNA